MYVHNKCVYLRTSILRISVCTCVLVYSEKIALHHCMYINAYLISIR